jgi:predicted RNA-binding Zn ribbon-like protein
MARQRFSRIGGDPALDFLNTQPIGDAGIDERLPDCAAVVAWCRESGLITAAQARRLAAAGESGAALHAIGALRERFRAALAAHCSGRPQWERLATPLNTALRRRPVVPRLRATRRGAVFESTHELRAAMDLTAVIASAIAAFVAGPELARARRCQDEACVLWFVDGTRNHSRRWCRMTGCGARAKAKAYYWRRKRTDAAAHTRSR